MQVAPILGGFLKKHFDFYDRKYLDNNLAIEKSYRPNLKRIQVKTTQKLCLLSMSQLEFGSEWQPCRVDVTPCQLPNIASSLMM